MGVAGTPEVTSPGSRRAQPTLGGALGVLFVAAGIAIGMRSLADNSFLTHLATGRLILESGSVPSHDPYTFTAAGHPWVVQSWLASVLYATAERVGGLDGVRVLTGATAGLLAGLTWHLLRPARGAVGRLAVGAMALAVGAGLWTERPYMLGLLAFALVALAAEGRLSPVWLLPAGWVWVNAHGSFPLGIVYLAVVALGSRLDGRDWSIELRCLRWAIPGMLAGAIGPLGPRVLLFPLDLLGRQELLSNVVEWQAPAFNSISDRAFLLQVMVAVVLVARRPSYRSALVTAVFTAAALLGARNVVVASVALLPSMASGLQGLGAVSSTDRPPYARLLALAGAGLGAVVITARLGLPALDLGKYPVDAIAFLDQSQVDLRDHRLAAPDYVGNFLEYVYGPGERVFYDDRFDMFPAAASEAAVALIHVDADALDRLARFDIELIAVPRSSPMAQVLALEPGWRVLYSDEGWVLTCQRGADLGGAVGIC